MAARLSPGASGSQSCSILTHEYIRHDDKGRLAGRTASARPLPPVVFAHPLDPALDRSRTSGMMRLRSRPEGPSPNEIEGTDPVCTSTNCTAP
jgi:hypothetical protein